MHIAVQNPILSRIYNHQNNNNNKSSSYLLANCCPIFIWLFSPPTNHVVTTFLCYCFTCVVYYTHIFPQNLVLFSAIISPFWFHFRGLFSSSARCWHCQILVLSKLVLSSTPFVWIVVHLEWLPYVWNTHFIV